MKRLLPLFLSLFLLAGCSGADTPVTQQLFAMNTTMTLTLYGSRASDAALSAQQAINRLDGLWSRTKASSDVSRLNAAAGDPAPETEVAPETGALLSRARELGALTGGALDITIAPIMDAWGFGTTSVFQESDFRVPSRTELDALLPLVDSGRLHVSGSAEAPLAWLDGPGMAVDLGAVAKGRAADLLVPLLTDSGVTSAILDLGGNLTALGTRPDGTPWRIGVKDPRNTETYFCILSLSDKTCSTSGSYERKFEVDGTTYHHILDPATGYPAESGLLSVTAVSSDGMLADGLSTACYVMGAEQSVRLWRAHGLEGAGFDLVLVREDGSVWITEGVEDGLDFRGKEAGYTYEIIRR
ncbi:FAD:protein FMN transferase [Intestinimonas butyriciproducens]|uniref:FAD:protein FMN transferase n=1 Tax=Intestinimonas butyriciproducens TaxID=1297617 RepID=UPI00242C55D6